MAEDSPPVADVRLPALEIGFAILVGVMVGAFIVWAVQFALIPSWPASTGAGLAVGGAVAWLMLGRVRKDRALLRTPVPANWGQLVREVAPFLDWEAMQDRALLLKRMQVFLHDQRIGTIGCTIDDGDRLRVALGAILLVRGFPHYRYPNIRDILIYPTSFDEDYAFAQEGGDDEDTLLGQVLEGGPLILALDSLRSCFVGDDYTNVVVHEFAHVVDDELSPVPETYRSESDGDLNRFFNDRGVRRAILAGESPLDDYALEEPLEFFAVCSEVFIEEPHLLAERHPALFEWMMGVYQQDPRQMYSGLATGDG